VLTPPNGIVFQADPESGITHRRETAQAWAPTPQAEDRARGVGGAPGQAPPPWPQQVPARAVARPCQRFCSSRSAPTRNAIQRSPRCPGEGRFALLTGRWRILRHITASPGKSATSRAALIFIYFEDGGIT
jgi:hypothetical protein